MYQKPNKSGSEITQGLENVIASTLNQYNRTTLQSKREQAEFLLEYTFSEI